ncbi:MAG: hypothetical protein ABIJ56_04880 [Pseudomonadota bacterium]
MTKARKMKNSRVVLSALCLLGGFVLQNFPKDLFQPPPDAASEGDVPPAPARAFSPSPEPAARKTGAEAETGGEDEKTLEGLARGGGVGKRVIHIEVNGIIDLGLAPFIERQLKGARDAAAVILEIDTPGGRVDAALNIRDALIDSKVKTVAFIHPRAISAGALISYACDVIAISTGGSIGAATPISLSGGQAQAVEEKMLSYFRAEMAATARAKGRRGDIAEAMVDKDLAIDGIIEAGKLLTLDTDNALKLKVADYKADSFDELLQALSLDGAQVELAEIGWAEIVARWLTHPVVSGLLMSIGVLAILIELYSPGFGAPGIVGLSCLAVFFLGHLVVKLAGWEEVALLAVGLVLLLIEIFVTTGFGVVGVLGIVLIVASLTMAMTALPLTVSLETGFLRAALIRTILSVGVAIVAFIGIIKLLPKPRAGHPIVDGSRVTARTFSDNPDAVKTTVSVGDSGVAHSHLRPSGRAAFGATIVDVITDGSFVDEGEALEILSIEGGKIVVREKG